MPAMFGHHTPNAISSHSESWRGQKAGTRPGYSRSCYVNAIGDNGCHCIVLLRAGDVARARVKSAAIAVTRPMRNERQTRICVSHVNHAVLIRWIGIVARLFTEDDRHRRRLQVVTPRWWTPTSLCRRWLRCADIAADMLRDVATSRYYGYTLRDGHAGETTVNNCSAFISCNAVTAFRHMFNMAMSYQQQYAITNTSPAQYHCCRHNNTI